MVQLFAGANLEYTPHSTFLITGSRLNIWPFLVSDNFSPTAINILLSNPGVTYQTATTISFGIYSLTEGTLRLINSASGSLSAATANITSSTYFITATNFSTPQNLSPGNYWVGVLLSLATTVIGVTDCRLYCGFNIATSWGLPYGFVGGRVNASTTSLYSTLTTASVIQGRGVVQTYSGAMPHIIMSA